MKPEAERPQSPTPSPRPRPAWLTTLPAELQPRLQELYATLDIGAYGLATMGMRSVFDLVAAQYVGDAGTFGQKLEALMARRLISSADRERLEVVIEAGNAAAHRGHVPDARAVHQLMDCVEHLLQGLYAFTEPLRALKSAIPKRR
jgi:Domain of unknown function (DUF4145)